MSTPKLHLLRSVCAMALVILAVPTPGRAEITEPDHIVYGYAAADGVPITAGQVEVRLNDDPSPVAAYTLGADAALGSLFVLRIPMDSVGERVPGRARSGDVAKIFINGEPAGNTPVGSRGSAQLFDADTVLRIEEPAFSISNSSLVEGDAGKTNMMFEITLSAPYAEGTLEVAWETEPGDPGPGIATSDVDFDSTGGIAQFTAGTQSQMVAVPINGDLDDTEGNEIFFVELSNASAGSTIANAQAQGTILDDDTPPTVSINDSSLGEPDTGAANMGFQISLSHTWKTAVTVAFATAQDGAAANPATAGLDYQTTSDSVVIPSGQVVGIVDIPILADDLDDEGSETFLVNLTSTSVGSLLDAQGEGTILDAAQVLTFIEKQTNGEGTSPSPVEGLVAPYAVEVYGEYVYVAGRNPGSIVIFRDPGAGNLEYVDTVDFDADDTGGLDQLVGVEDLLVSPDGEHLYAAAFSTNSVLVFARSSAAPWLTLLEVETDAVNDPGDVGGEVNGIAGASGLAMDSAGEHLYVTGSGDNAVAVFDRVEDDSDANFGLLSFQEANVNGGSDGNGSPIAGIQGAVAAVLTSDDQHLYVAGMLSNAVSTFQRLDGGGLKYLGTNTDGAGGNDGLRGAISLALDPTDSTLYVAAQTDGAGAAVGSGALGVFSRDTSARSTVFGELTFLEVHRNGAGGTGTQGLAGASSVAVSFDGRYVYSTGWTDNAVTVFERAAGGALTYREVKEDGVGIVDGISGANDVAERGDGQFLYVAGNGEASVAVFRRDLVDPDNPTLLTSTSHTLGVWSNDPTIDVEWSGAADDGGGAGLDGYSVLFDQLVDTEPDEVVEVADSGGTHTTTSSSLTDAQDHWFHLRTCDDAGNCSGPVHLGPFWIDQTPPDNPDELDITITGIDDSTGTLFTTSQVKVTWPAVATTRGAADSGSGVLGFDTAFSGSSTAVCGQVLDTPITVPDPPDPAPPHQVVSSPLSNGQYYFHLCTVDEAGNWSDVVSRGPFIIQTADTAAPTVTKLDSVTGTDDAVITDDEVVSDSITQLLVHFSEPMFDGAGPDGAANADNYMLIGPGFNEIFETGICGAVAGDDQAVPIDEVDYAAQVSAVKIAGDLALPIGAYRFLACGSTTLIDPSANPLDGTSNGTGGDDYVQDFSVDATNYLRNPNFDDVTFSFWVPSGTSVGPDTDDLDGAFSSGSAEALPETGEDTVALVQCLELPGTLPELAQLSGWARISSDATVAPLPAASLEVEFFDDVSCSGNSLGLANSTVLESDGLATQGGEPWVFMQSAVFTPPAGALWAKVSAVATRDGDDFTTHFDSLFFGEAPEPPFMDPIFSDDFESGDMQAWE